MCPCEPRACLFLIRRVLTDSAFRDSPLAYIIMTFLLLHGTPHLSLPLLCSSSTAYSRHSCRAVKVELGDIWCQNIKLDILKLMVLWSILKKVVPDTFHTFNFVATSGQETLQIYRHKICRPLNRVRPFPWESVQQENMSSVHASCHFWVWYLYLWRWFYAPYRWSTNNVSWRGHLLATQGRRFGEKAPPPSQVRSLVVALYICLLCISSKFAINVAGVATPSTKRTIRERQERRRSIIRAKKEGSYWSTSSVPK